MASPRWSDPPDYQVGQRVWLSTKDLSLKVEGCKLAPRFIGPLPNFKIINPVAVRLHFPRIMRINPICHISRLKPQSRYCFGPDPRPPPHARLINGTPAFTVKKLLHSRHWGRGTHYLVDWDGYGSEECSCVPIKNKSLKDFHRDHPDQPRGPSGGGP